MSGTEYGPSYYDVSTLVDQLRARWNRDFSFRVCPPIRIVATGKYSSWHVWCEVRKTPGYGPVVHLTGSSYGQGGAWKTLPAALFHAASLAEDALNDAERAAERASAF